MKLHEDFIEFILIMIQHEVEFIVVGAHAMGFYGIPRATGDFDFWIRQTRDNAIKVIEVIEQYFGTTMGLSEEDVLDDETIQFGVQPVRIDLLKKLTGISNQEIWDRRVKGRFADFDLYFISKELLIKNKKATGRHKDIADANILIDYHRKQNEE
jgi:hypothetical protein